MRFSPVNRKIQTGGGSPQRVKTGGQPKLLDFLNAGDEFQGILGMLFRNPGGRES